jgi:hypothetical protein
MLGLETLKVPVQLDATALGDNVQISKQLETAGMLVIVHCDAVEPEPAVIYLMPESLQLEPEEFAETEYPVHPL